MARLQRAFFTLGAADPRAAANGPAANGPAANGPAANGPAANGPAANGPATNGPATNGPGAARPLKAGFFGLIFWDFFGFFWIFFRFFLTFFDFFYFRPWVTGVGYLNFDIFKGTLFSIRFGDAIFD